MFTKADPGRFDRYAQAEPGEPLFVLLARDNLAPFLVSIWSSCRYGDFEAASAKFDAMLGGAVRRYGPTPTVNEAGEALDCAMAMFAWAKARAEAPATAADPATVIERPNHQPGFTGDFSDV